MTLFMLYKMDTGHFSSPSKRPKKSNLSKAKKEMILNAYKLELQRNCEAPKEDAAENTVLETETSKALIFQIV